MKCESCKINEIEFEELLDDGLNPFRLCHLCQNRLLNKALRPSEFFNLTAIHGHCYYLGGDFYDLENGAATQPYIEVIDINEFPFPDLKTIQFDVEKLVDFACVQYGTTHDVVGFLKQHEKKSVLSYLDSKVKYNRSINYKAYEIAGKVLGSAAMNWLRQEWYNRKENELLIFAEPLYKCLPLNEAFTILTIEIEKTADRNISENSMALLYFQSEKTLDWLEKIQSKITHLSKNWGVLASSSQFSWSRAEKWLTLGRPLSLVALDALIYCTTTQRENQALWLQRNPPKLLNKPSPNIIANRLDEYVKKDSVPRIKLAAETIINNILEAKE